MFFLTCLPSAGFYLLLGLFLMFLPRYSYRFVTADSGVVFRDGGSAVDTTRVIRAANKRAYVVNRWQSHTATTRLFSTFMPRSVKLGLSGRRVKNMTLNFGPNHPAAHGILRLTIQAQGEVLQRVDPQFGFLHRGTEKLAELRNYLQTLPYFDRFDYVANIFQEHTYCAAVEAAVMGGESYVYCLNYIRTLFDELSRVLNHLLTLSATCLDLGSMGPIFWAFEERERLMEIFERVSGARMHTALYKPYSID
jgi:hypothetical protein